VIENHGFGTNLIGELVQQLQNDDESAYQFVIMFVLRVTNPASTARGRKRQHPHEMPPPRLTKKQRTRRWRPVLSQLCP